MDDILEALLNGTPENQEALVAALRRQKDVGTALAMSGSQRGSKLGASMADDATATAAGLGQQAQTASLAQWRAMMEAEQARSNRDAANERARLDRASREGIAAGRISSAERIAADKLKAGSGGDGTGDVSVMQDNVHNLSNLKNRINADILPRVDGFSSGFASLSKVIPGTPAATLDKLLEPIRSNEALSKLNKMREDAAAMKMKGSGLGQVTEREISLLISNLVSLDTGLPADELRAELGKLMAQYDRAINAYNADIEKARRMGMGVSGATDTEMFDLYMDEDDDGDEIGDY